MGKMSTTGSGALNLVSSEPKPPPRPEAAAAGDVLRELPASEPRRRLRLEPVGPEPAPRRRASPSEGASGAPRGPLGRSDAPEPAKAPTAAATTRRRRSAPGAASQSAEGLASRPFLIAGVGSLVWAGSMWAFALNFQNPLGAFGYPPFALAAWGSVCLLPPAFAFILAFYAREARAIAAETLRARRLADQLVAPAALAAAEARGEVARAAEVAANAERQLLELRRLLAEESQRLVEAAEAAERRAQEVTSGLRREREEISGLADSLGASVEAVTQALAAGARAAAETSRLASERLEEAENRLAARTADLEGAANAAADLSALAGARIGHETERLEAAAAHLGRAAGEAGASLFEERARLETLTAGLAADQDAVAARLERQRGLAAEAAAEASALAADLERAAETGAAHLRGLVAEAETQLRALGLAAERERAAADAAAREGLRLFTGLVAEERQAAEAAQRQGLEVLRGLAEETRAATASGADAARMRVEQLGEAAFAAGQKAEQAFESKISAARRVIDQSAELFEGAGERAAARLEGGLSGARQALLEIRSLLEDVEAVSATLPEAARARTEAVRAALEDGLRTLVENARRSSEEAKGLDAEFQARMRSNYQVLTEAVRLLERSSAARRAAEKGSADAPSAPASPAVLPAALPRDPEGGASTGLPSRGDLAPALSPVAAAPSPAPEPPPPIPSAPLPAAADPEAGLRPRLRLTEAPAPEAAHPAERGVAAPPQPRPPQEPGPPLATTAAAPPPRTVFQRPAASRPPEGPESAANAGPASEWTWKDLLSSIDEPPAADEILAERLLEEIQALGLDVATVLPNARVAEIAAAVRPGDAQGLREAVRGAAPAAVRRISRRVLTDRSLKAQTERFLESYEALLADSRRRDRDGEATASLLASEEGRAFLLLKAAVGELH